MKFNGMGTMGHIALSVTDVDRAVNYYRSQGFTFDMSTAVYDGEGKMKDIYFEGEFGGFAVHLVRA